MTTDATTADQRLVQLGIELPAAPQPLGAYVPAVLTGNLLFLSGMLATAAGKPTHVGIVGRDLDVSAARAAAYHAALNVLARIRQELGSLDRVRRMVRLGVQLACTPEFTEHPLVADAASELFRDVLGVDTVSTRLVYGVVSLPLGSPVVLEVILEVRP